MAGAVALVDQGRMTSRREASERAVRRGRSTGRRALIARTLAAVALLPVASRIPAYARLTVALLSDDRVPSGRKAILAGVIGYALAPVDMIPERIPLLGVFDDVVVAVLGLEIFLAGVPDDLLEDKLAALGIPRAAFDEDRARVRRTVPRPIRRIIKRLPTTFEAIGRIVHDLGVGTGLRSRHTKEGSPA